jgi:hypothetical protein
MIEMEKTKKKQLDTEGYKYDESNENRSNKCGPLLHYCQINIGKGFVHVRFVCSYVIMEGGLLIINLKLLEFRYDLEKNFTCSNEEQRIFLDALILECL